MKFSYIDWIWNCQHLQKYPQDHWTGVNKNMSTAFFTFWWFCCSMNCNKFINDHSYFCFDCKIITNLVFKWCQKGQTHRLPTTNGNSSVTIISHVYSWQIWYGKWKRLLLQTINCWLHIYGQVSTNANFPIYRLSNPGPCWFTRRNVTYIYM